MDIIQHNMTVQEVFNTPAIKEIEQQILLLFDKSKNNWRSGDADTDTDTIAIRSLLEVRKNLLNSLFVLDEENKQLLTDFNEALKKQLLDTRDRTIKMMEAVKSAGFSGEIFAQGKCYLGYDYPLIHPVQSNRAKKMWCILNGTYDCYMPLYEDGVESSIKYNIESEAPSENYVLYLDDEPEKNGLDNWNEHLDRELSADMHLVYAFHNLYEHIGFSIFDLLWVRNFNLEINLEYDYSTYPDGHEYDDPDWDSCDFLD